MEINVLVNGVPWFGKYSGYECLSNYFPENIKVTTTYSPDSKLTRSLGKVVNTLYNRKFGNVRNDGIWAAYKFVMKSKIKDVSHILYADGNLNVFKEFGKGRKDIFGTIHFPISQWKNDRLKNLSYLNNGIILYKEEMDRFGEYMSPNQLKFIRHGVDTDFFKPGPQSEIKKNKILFVGSYLRNFDMFLQVYQLINKDISHDYEFHFIIPKHLRTHSVLYKLSENNNVFFHEKLSDEELLRYYQTSYLLLMPMEDSGANTAIIQALATALPVITTDVGGIRSYGGGEIFPLIANNDYVSMADLFNKYCANEDYRHSIAKQQRKFAQDNMEWHQIANEHLNFYLKR